ncbi:hypothetical protein KR009_011423, partial [Drosophila setifemur]
STSPLTASQWVQECLESNDIDVAVLQEMVNRASSEEDAMDASNTERKYKCFFNCLAEKANILDANGYIDVDKLDEIETLSAKKRDYLNTCKMEHDKVGDKCDYAFDMVACLSAVLDPDDENNSKNK